MLLIGSITVTGILANTLLYPAIPNILEDFGLDDGSAGVLVASASVPGIAIAPLVGVLADRYGRRRVLVPCLVAFGCFGALGAFAPGFGWLVLARLGQGVGSAGLINLANALISDTWSGVERARHFGYNSAVLTVSLAVLPAVGGTLTDLGSWRWAFAPYPLALITALVVMARLDHGPTDRSTSIGAQVRAAARIARSVRVLTPLSLTFVTFIMIFGLMLTVLPLHLARSFGLSAGERGLVMALPALGATTGALVLGWIRSRRSSRAVVIAAFVLFALAFPVVGLAGTLLLLVPAGVVFGLGEGLLLPTLTDVVAGSASETSRGAVLSLQVSAIRSGQTVGPLLAGVAVTAVGTGSTFLLGGGLAAMVVIAALVVQLPPPPPAVPVDDR
ncbi:MAG: MFS transporter [Acidimicrobiales bacterium]|nr:MFS transporter [Acidimicrobiales bacterium]